MSNISRLDQRKIEAALLARMYEVLSSEVGQGKALELVREIIERESFAAGQAFAASAPGGPNLEHFLTVVDSWRGSGALEVGEVTCDDNTASFPVTRCEYVRAYREMNVPEELLPIIACGRDAFFVKGYSDRLVMNREQTIGLGFETCDFAFTWE